MINYDVIVSFLDGSTEILPVHARNRGRALVTACYAIDRWEPAKQDSVIMLTVSQLTEHAAVQPVPKPKSATVLRPTLLRRNVR